MIENQKLRNNEKTKKRKRETKYIQRMNFSSENAEKNDPNDKDQKKLYENISMVEWKANIKKRNQELEHYTSLFQSLEEVKAEIKYVKKMDTKRVPYEIPEVYSLKEEIEKLAVMNKKIKVISHKICKKDIDAIESDWNRVGSDINEAIFRV